MGTNWMREDVTRRNALFVSTRYFTFLLSSERVQLLGSQIVLWQMQCPNSLRRTVGWSAD